MMADNFKTEAPTLTFEPFGAATKQQVSSGPTPQQMTVEQEYESYPLSDEEKKVIDDFASQIDLYNSQLVLQYGAGAQKKISDFSEQALENVKSKDLGEVGQMLSNVVSELKSFDTDEEDKGFFGNIFKKSSNKISSMKAKYAKAETNVDQICKVLEGHQVQLLKDSAMLDQMYKMNTAYFKELTMYIIAGKKKIAKARNEEIPQMVAKAEQSKLPEDMSAANDYASLCERFDKKIHDLELTRVVAMQMAPQIRLIQNNDILMSEKIQSMLVNTIPLWKSQMVLALGVNHSRQAAEAQRQVTDMTNELLRKNAETLKMASVETAKALERGVVDVETLTATNEMLITTIDDVMKIQEEGRTKRREAEVQLTKLENDLKSKLLEINKRRLN